MFFQKLVLLWFISLSLIGFQANSQTNYNNTTTNEIYSDEEAAETPSHINSDYAEDTYSEIYPDSLTTSTPVLIDRSAWNKLTDDKAFLYKDKKQPDLADSAIMEFFSKIVSFLSNSGKWIIWVLVIALVSVVAFYISKKLKLSPIKKSSKTNTQFDATTEELNFDKLIEEALKEGNKIRAVELMYQHALYLVHKKELIKIYTDTTNAEILRTTRSSSIYPYLKKIISGFEYTVFGEYPLSMTQLQAYQQQYTALKQQL